MSESKKQKASGSMAANVVVLIFWSIFLSAKMALRIFRFTFRVLRHVWIAKDQQSASTMVGAQGASGQLFVTGTVVGDESVDEGDEPFQIASRIHTAQLKRDQNCVGRLWLYTYEQAGTIRQVFKINDCNVRTALGTELLDLGSIQYNPTTGKAGIDAIKEAALDSVKQRLAALV